MFKTVWNFKRTTSGSRTFSQNLLFHLLNWGFSRWFSLAGSSFGNPTNNFGLKVDLLGIFVLISAHDTSNFVAFRRKLLLLVEIDIRTRITLPCVLFTNLSELIRRGGSFKFVFCDKTHIMSQQWVLFDGLRFSVWLKWSKLRQTWWLFQRSQLRMLQLDLLVEFVGGLGIRVRLTGRTQFHETSFLRFYRIQLYDLFSVQFLRRRLNSLENSFVILKRHGILYSVWSPNHTCFVACFSASTKGVLWIICRLLAGEVAWRYARRRLMNVDVGLIWMEVEPFLAKIIQMIVFEHQTHRGERNLVSWLRKFTRILLKVRLLICLTLGLIVLRGDRPHVSL